MALAFDGMGPPCALGLESSLDASELLERYAKGERDFRGADLLGAVLKEVELPEANLGGADLGGANLSGGVLRRTNLAHANLTHANLTGANLDHANLTGAQLIQADLCVANLCVANLVNANLAGANLEGANLRGANLEDANLSASDLSRASLNDASLIKANLNYAELTSADLTGSTLIKANLSSANLSGAKLVAASLEGANFNDARFHSTAMASIDLGPIVRAAVRHNGPSDVDWNAVVRSVNEPRLKDFLRRAGMADVFVEYMVDCARSLEPGLIFTLLQSTFISYGGPDEAFARKLNEALERRGATTFFFRDDAPPGERLHRVMRKGVNDHDRTILICSEASLQRPGLLNELEETLAREARDGGQTYLIPVRLDDYVLSEWAPPRADLAQAVRDRVISDFSHHEVAAEFDAEVAKLIAVLKKPLAHK